MFCYDNNAVLAGGCAFSAKTIPMMAPVHIMFIAEPPWRIVSSPLVSTYFYFFREVFLNAGEFDDDEDNGESPEQQCGSCYTLKLGSGPIK